MPTILEEYIAKHPGSEQRYSESVKVFPGGVTHDTRYAQPFPLFMTHGEGPLKWDVDGNEYVDYVSGHGALLLGHSHPAIAEAVSKQILRGLPPTRKCGGPRRYKLWFLPWKSCGFTVQAPKPP